MEPNVASSTEDIATPVMPVDVEEKIEQAMRTEIRRIRGNPAEVSSSFRADVSALFSEARRKGIRAESLVIALKNAWHSIPDTRSFARPVAMDSLLSEMVTMALDEFYDPASTAVQRAD